MRYRTKICAGRYFIPNLNTAHLFAARPIDAEMDGLPNDQTYNQSAHFNAMPKTMFLDTGPQHFV